MKKKTVGLKDNVALMKGQHTNQWNRRESPEVFSHKYGNLIWDKDKKIQ